MNKPRYTYSPRGRLWAIYDGITKQKVADFVTKEEAKKETYRLNGWKIN
jgi:hypothetical protein